jgi:hypothetical protein
MIAYSNQCRCRETSTETYSTSTTATNAATACEYCNQTYVPTVTYVVEFDTARDDELEKPEPVEPRELPAYRRTMKVIPCERAAHSVPSWPPQLARPPPQMF